MKPHLILIFAVQLLVLSACGQDTVDENIDRVRAIKPYYISEPAGADIRLYSGSIVSSDTSGLSFAVAGTVATVAVNQGEQVTAGQVLATLETGPFELDVEAARSQLSAAQANFDDKKSQIVRQKELFERGWVAEAALDQAQAAYDSANADLNLARSRLGTAERDLSKARLTAPFDGVVAERNVEPFEEVQLGQTLFLVNSEGALDVIVSVADSVVGRLSIGGPVTVDVTTVPGCGCNGRITEIGTASGAANTVTVKASLLRGSPGLLPGMAAEVGLMLSGDGQESGYLVPVTAIAPGDDNVQGYLYKFDRDSQTVRRVAVRGGEGARDNFVEIVEGVTAGDIVAAAGVSFLRDGQAVKLLGEEN